MKHENSGEEPPGFLVRINIPVMDISLCPDVAQPRPCQYHFNVSAFRGLADALEQLHALSNHDLPRQLLMQLLQLQCSFCKYSICSINCKMRIWFAVQQLPLNPPCKLPIT